MTALVLLPGMDGTGTLFNRLADCLPPDLRPIVIGYPSDCRLGYDDLIAYVHARLPRDEPFVLLGESFSGPVAIGVAASHPAGLRGLVLCCSFCSNPRPALRPLHPLIGMLPLPLWGLPLIRPLLLDPGADEDQVAALRRAVAAVQPQVMRGRLRSVLAVDVSAAVRQIDVPTLYLQATADRLITDSACRRIAEVLPSTEIVRIDGPHLLLQARPGKAARAIGDFVRRRCS